MKPGLEGVIVAETTLSCVDGEAGKLLIGGAELSRIAGRSFEDVAELLGLGVKGWGELRREAYHRLRPHFEELEKRLPMDAVNLGLSLLAFDSSPGNLIASFPVILAAGQNGARTPEPETSLGHVQDLLRMFHLREASQAEVSALSTYLVTVSEHGMNASTFTARVVASTGANHRAATLAALGALSGPLHGGAPGPVLDLLDELAECKEPRSHLANKIEAGDRLMGFGHRVYRTRDPRAQVLQNAVRELNDSPQLEHAAAMESLAQEVLADLKPGRVLRTNVEFYTAVLLKELGFDRTWFTPLFATGRILGWMAHYREQEQTGRLMRPKARYVGNLPSSGAEVAVVAPA